MFCSPSWMKTGRMRFAGDILVSEMAPLILGLRLFLLGLDGKSCVCARCDGQAGTAEFDEQRYTQGFTCGGTMGVPGGTSACTSNHGVGLLHEVLSGLS